MKFLYPIKKLNIKPWIKYWLLKKLNDSGESTLKAVTLSSGTLQKVDKSKSLSIKEYYGNTIQNGTPTPEAPVEIKTISGDNTFTINSNSYRLDLGGKNIFNKTTIVAGDIRGQSTSIRLSSRQALWLDTGTYTMSTNAVSPFRYACSVQNVGVPPLSSYPTFIVDSGWKTGNTSYTFTLSTAGYFMLALSKTSGNITVDEVADFEYQLEKRKYSNSIQSIHRQSY